MQWVVNLLLLVAASTVLAQDPNEGLRLVEEGRTTLEERSLGIARDYWSQQTQKHANDSLAWYQLARVNYYLCEARVAGGEKKSGEDALDVAITSVQQSIRLNEHSADAHALLADLYGRKISLGSFIAGMKYGPKVGDENKRAMELDSNSPRVRASLGRQYLMAPRTFGGDVEKAIENLREATRLDPRDDEAFVWLAMAYRKKGAEADANRAIQEALRLNPRSQFAKRIQSQE